VLLRRQALEPVPVKKTRAPRLLAERPRQTPFLGVAVSGDFWPVHALIDWHVQSSKFAMSLLAQRPHEISAQEA
jgi:hypothetical protein